MLDIVEVMTSSPSLRDLTIHHTKATDGGQSFAGINNGTVTYAGSESDSETKLNDLLNKTLPVSADASFNARKREHEPTCLDGTRTDLLYDIYNWVDGDSPQSIFWLNGLAGTGKSTIAQTVANTYSAKKALGASFFFSRGGGDVGNAGNFVTTVALQLANNIPNLKAKICDAISKRSDIATLSLQHQWQDLVLTPLSNLDGRDSRSRYVLVIDALDECEDQNDINIILRLLSKVRSLKAVQLRVFLTSRPELPIRSGLAKIDEDEHLDFVLHSISSSIVDQDISVFLKHEFKDITQAFGFQAGWPGEKEIASLVWSSNGLFIWVATACRFIKEDSQLAQSRLLLLLNGGNYITEPALRLDEIYTAVLTNSVQGKKYNEEETLRLHEQFRQILGPIILSPEPLSLSTLARILGKDVTTLNQTLSNLHSVIHVPKAELDAPESDTVRLLHPSFRDFLLNKKRCSNLQFYIDEKSVHREMYEKCIEIMSTHLRRDICNLQHPGAYTFNLSRNEVHSHIQPHIQYACRFWVYHYIRSDADINNDAVLEGFLGIHFLHWLEALALLRCASDAVVMVHMLDSEFSNKRGERLQNPTRFRDKLKSIFSFNATHEMRRNLETPTETEWSSLPAFVHDALRFVLTFQPVLEVAPLQIYAASLIFSPNISIIKNKFSADVPPWVSCMSGVSENWNPHLQTLEGHFDRVTAVAFSPDSRTLASASSGNIKLWDTRSGELLQSVTLLDAKVENRLRTSTGQQPFAVIAIAFSPDGKTLALASTDMTVELWDAGLEKLLQTVKLLQTLQPHLDSVTAIAFSSDGKTLASAVLDTDCTVKLWDARSGKLWQTLKSQEGYISAIAFSPDDKTLALVLYDDIIELWDAKLWKLRRKLKGHQSVACTIAFSSDSKTLVSVLVYSCVELWDATSGKLRQTLKSQEGYISAMAFSLDGKTLALGLESGKVKLRDAKLEELVQTPEDHSGNIQAITFSLDGEMLASASTDNTVKLWDTRSGKLRQTFKGHLNWVNAITFTSDGETLASASADRTIKLWDTRSEKLRQTFKCHSDWVNALAFSPDGKTLASASRDNTIKLWGSESGRLLQTFSDISLSNGLSFIDGSSLRVGNSRVVSIDSSAGNIQASSSPSSQQSIHVKGQWVLQNGERLLWLPAEYQPYEVAVHDNGTVGFGYLSGRVLIMKFTI